VAEVTDDNRPDDSFWVDFEGTYDCGFGPENYSTQVEIEPIPNLRVSKDVIAGEPSMTGEIVEYLVTIENLGSAAAQYFVFDCTTTWRK